MKYSISSKYENTYIFMYFHICHLANNFPNYIICLCCEETSSDAIPNALNMLINNAKFIWGAKKSLKAPCVNFF